MVGDRILSVNGQPVWLCSDVEMLLSRSGEETVDLVIRRDDTRITLDDLPLQRQEYVYQGETQLKYGLVWALEEVNPLSRLKLAWYQTLDFVRMVWFGLSDLVHGRAGLKDLSGPVGIVDAIGDVGSQSATLSLGIWNVMYFVAFIAVNLAVMNLLPIPALDGGRIFFVLVNALFTAVTKKEIDPKYEGYIHTAGFVLLIILMIVVAFNDIWKLIF